MKKLKKLRREAIAHGRKAQASLVVRQPLRLMFMDEARFGRIPETRACWAANGTRPRVLTQLVRTALYVFAGVIPETGHLDALILPTVNIDSMLIFLQEVSLQHPHEHLIIILDQASWHTSPQLKLPPNLTLHFLPPYHPQLHPVEHLWDSLRERCFSNRFVPSLQALEDQLVNPLHTMMKLPELIKSMTFFSWLKTLLMNAKYYKNLRRADKRSVIRQSSTRCMTLSLMHPTQQCH